MRPWENLGGSLCGVGETEAVEGQPPLSACVGFGLFTVSYFLIVSCSLFFSFVCLVCSRLASISLKTRPTRPYHSHTPDGPVCAAIDHERRPKLCRPELRGIRVGRGPCSVRHALPAAARHGQLSSPPWAPTSWVSACFLHTGIVHLILIRIECLLLAGQFPDSEMQPAMGYQHSLGMLPQGYGNPVFNASQPHGSRMPLSGSPPPQSPALYDPLSPPVSGSDASDGGVYHHSRNSSATGSPTSSRANSLVHRQPLRYNPTPSPTSSSGGRRSRGRSLSDDDDGMGVGLAESLANTRKEATRRQRIEAEQRRRDELRDGYARLKDVLPISNQKSSKVSLLERGVYFLHETAWTGSHFFYYHQQLPIILSRRRRLTANSKLVSSS